MWSSAGMFVHLGRKALRPAALVLTPTLSGAYYYHFHHRNIDDRVNRVQFKELYYQHATALRDILYNIIPYSSADAASPLNTSSSIPSINKSNNSDDVMSKLSWHPAGRKNPKLPTFSAAQVRATQGNAHPLPIYVTFRDGVYDISEFSQSHPGGEQILLAAGGPLEAYWSMYPQHATEFVLDLLEELRVGNLQRDEQWLKDHNKSNTNKKGAYETDPKRHPALIVQSTAPYTAEPPPHALVSAYHTPNELFYVRNHMPVPEIDPEKYRLSVVDKSGKELKSLSLKDLMTKFEQVNVSATVQCAGNRRNELGRVRKVKGGGWEIGAISNANWTGVRLSDVLAYAISSTLSPDYSQSKQLIRDEKHGKHICFEGLDEDPVTGVRYAASIPMDILKRHGEHTILAYEMNGVTLPRDHGFPLRVVVPGVVGARHVKWVGTISLSDEESDSHWQRKDYRSFAPDVDWKNVNFDESPSIQEMPVVSAICTHVIDNEEGVVYMRGYAWSGDGKEIIRVDVSANGGKTWTAAQLLDDNKNGKRNESYDWKLWSASVAIPKNDGCSDSGQVELVCKAIDSAYNSQPDGAANVWNLRGLLNNCWHRVEVNDDAEQATEENPIMHVEDS